MRCAIYTRSSKDINDVSCESQVHDLMELLKRSGDTLVEVYQNKALSSTRDARPEFNRMTGEAKTGKFQRLYVLDTARLGRDQGEVVAAKMILRKKCGVEIIYKNLPQSGSYMDPIFESLMESFDRLHSLKSAEESRRGQRQNIRQQWRAGGSAPFGYCLRQVEIG